MKESIRTLKRALNICRIPRESLMKLAVPKGVYLAWPSDQSLRALATGTVERTSADWPAADAAAAWWRCSILPKAVADPERMRVLREFKKTSVLDRLGVWR